jgi:hypothetical protein
MASDDPNYNALHQSNVGCFGLFECINDRDVAAALFERGASWLREKGRTEIMGPIDYSTELCLRSPNRWVSVSSDNPDLT